MTDLIDRVHPFTGADISDDMESLFGPKLMDGITYDLFMLAQELGYMPGQTQKTYLLDWVGYIRNFDAIREQVGAIKGSVFSFTATPEQKAAWDRVMMRLGHKPTRHVEWDPMLSLADYLAGIYQTQDQAQNLVAKFNAVAYPNGSGIWVSPNDPPRTQLGNLAREAKLKLSFHTLIQVAAEDANFNPQPFIVEVISQYFDDAEGRTPITELVTRLGLEERDGFRTRDPNILSFGQTYFARECARHIVRICIAEDRQKQLVSAVNDLLDGRLSFMV